MILCSPVEKPAYNFPFPVSWEILRSVWVQCYLSWLEKNNNTRLVGLTPIWAIHLMVGLNDPWDPFQLRIFREICVGEVDGSIQAEGYIVAVSESPITSCKQRL